MGRQPRSWGSRWVGGWVYGRVCCGLGSVSRGVGQAHDGRATPSNDRHMVHWLDTGTIASTTSLGRARTRRSEAQGGRTGAGHRQRAAQRGGPEGDGAGEIGLLRCACVQVIDSRVRFSRRHVNHLHAPLVCVPCIGCRFQFRGPGQTGGGIDCVVVVCWYVAHGPSFPTSVNDMRTYGHI